MLSPFICGSFHNQEEDDENQISPCSTPTRKSRKSSAKDKNPYATRGLDKFSALLAELEEKRRQIYSQVGSQDISFVRFVYSSSNDCVPVIVKMKDPQRPSMDHQLKEQRPTDHQSNKVQVINEETKLESDNKKKDENKKKKVYFKLHKWRRPSYYMPLFIILILLFLAFFGRSVAILCTSIGWYLVPTLSSKTSGKPTNSNKKKKQLVRRFSEVGTRSNNHIGSDGKNFIKSPHGRQNSF